MSFLLKNSMQNHLTLKSINFDTTSPTDLKNLSGLLICLLWNNFFLVRRGDLRSPAGEHSSPLPCIGKRFCDFSANCARPFILAFFVLSSKLFYPIIAVCFDENGQAFEHLIGVKTRNYGNGVPVPEKRRTE